MRHGFSLVELSIVLVILGLLTGGILAGQSLIRAAEMRSVTADVNRYSAAVYSFRDKYFALPGDMANATKFWGAQHATPATCQTTASSTALTCDGDGNGQVADCSYESFRFWQHLANAGLVEGSYSGVAGSGGVCAHLIGTNAPRGKISSSGFGYSYLGNFAGDTITYASNYGNMFWVGSVGAPNSRPQDAVFKAEEAWNIDTKTDDGLPAQGKVFARLGQVVFGNANSCTTSTSQTDYTGTYRLTSTAINCALMIKTE